MKILLLSLFLVVLFTSNLFAQKSNSIKVNVLNEITIKSESLIELKPTKKNGQNILEKYDEGSLSEIVKHFTSVKPQANSRGESLFCLRDANERQIGLFYDRSIPLNNRVNSLLLPSNDCVELITFSTNFTTFNLVSKKQKSNYLLELTSNFKKSLGLLELF